MTRRGYATLSITVRQGKSWSDSWKTTARSGPGRKSSLPAKEMTPPSGLMKPAIALRSVDFPHPEGPRSMTFSPAQTSKLTSSTARFVLSCDPPPILTASIDNNGYRDCIPPLPSASNKDLNLLNFTSSIILLNNDAD